MLESLTLSRSQEIHFFPRGSQVLEQDTSSPSRQKPCDRWQDWRDEMASGRAVERLDGGYGQKLLACTVAQS